MEEFIIIGRLIGKISMHTLVVGKVIDYEFSVLHMVTYPEKPSQSDIDSLREELRNDEEFGFGDKIDSLEIKYLEFDENGVPQGFED